jgi:hypothetical protein
MVAEEPVVEVGLKDAIAPDGRPLTGPRLTDPPFQFARVIETVELADAPCITVCEEGLTESPKLGAFCEMTTSVIDAVWLKEPLVAVTVGV